MENNGYDNEDDYTSNADSGKEEETYNNIDFVITLHLTLTSENGTTFLVEKPCRTSPYIGHKFVMEILNGHHDRCY